MATTPAAVATTAPAVAAPAAAVAAPPPAPPKKRSGRWLYISLAAGAVLIVGIAADAASSGDKKKAAAPIATSSPTTSSAAATPAADETTEAETPTPTPPAEPAPDGTYTGSCDYELSDNMNNYPAHAGDLNGEVDVENTGNVGIVLKVTISWPQLGHAPIAMHKTVKVPYSGSLTVPFTRPVSGSEIDRLQSYQGSHDDDGCKYNGTITDTFGKVH